MNLDIPQTIENVLRNEEIENEKKINLARITVLAFFGTMMTIARLVMGEPMHKTFLVIAPTSLFYLLISFFLLQRLLKREYQPTLKHLLILLDLVYVIITIVGVSQMGQPYASDFRGLITAPPFVIFFLINALSGLRFDFKTSIYCALVSVLIIFGLGFYDFYSDYGHFHRIMVTVFKAAIVGGTGLVSGYIGHRTKGLIVQTIKEQEEKRFIKGIFGRYLPTEVMKSLIENPSSLELGGERRKVTIMMTDLRGFTVMSERLEPEQVVQMLNIYFDVMVDVVLKYNGTINEIIGDALLVIFGAPQEIPDRTQKAIACAIEMQNAMVEVNEENRAKGLPELEMGIGLNETEVIVGNIGSSKRSKYAVVGSGVNMTSRIESYTVGGQILISESARQEAGEVLRIDAQRDVLPKGAETPLRIYEVGGIAGHYNLALEGKDPDLVTLAREILIQYTKLEGKDVGKKGLQGSVVRLSKNCAEIVLREPIAILTNLKMNLVDVDETLSKRDFYGKVIAGLGENGTTHVVHFTSIPPEVDAYFQALRQYTVRQGG
jgi:class 3 adenylate cyclase